MIAEQRKTKIYIAAPFFSDYHKKVVFGIIEELENRSDKFEFFSPFHASQPIWDGKSPAEAGPEARQKVFKCNYVNIGWCDILFAWVGGNSSGYDMNREKVKGFASSATFNPLKVVILDEADAKALNASALAYKEEDKLYKDSIEGQKKTREEE